MLDRARAVIIGSGICGSSIALHLAQLGWADIVMLEQGALTRDGGRYSIANDRMPGAIASLAKQLLEMEATGDRARVEKDSGRRVYDALRPAPGRVGFVH